MPCAIPSGFPFSRPADGAFFVATTAGPTSGGVRANVLAGQHSAGALPLGAVILVPWAHGPDCSPIRWDESRPWKPPADTAFYTGRLRPKSDWISGVPTFDILMAWREPMLQTNDSRLYRASPSELVLTPAEFLGFYATLPTDRELAQRSQQALARVDAWAADHPTLANRDPARSIRANLKRAVSQGLR